MNVLFLYKCNILYKFYIFFILQKSCKYLADDTGLSFCWFICIGMFVKPLLIALEQLHEKRINLSANHYLTYFYVSEFNPKYEIEECALSWSTNITTYILKYWLVALLSMNKVVAAAVVNPLFFILSVLIPQNGQIRRFCRRIAWIWPFCGVSA